MEAEAPQTLHLLVGRSIVITSPARIKRVSIADPTVAEAIVVSPNQVLVNGRTPGGVSLIVWDETDQSQSFEVSVDIDVLGLSQKIREVFPNEDVHLDTSRDVVMLSGKISSKEIADKILEIVKGVDAEGHEPDASADHAKRRDSAPGAIRGSEPRAHQPVRNQHSGTARR